MKNKSGVTSGRLPARQVLEALAASRVGDVIVIGNHRGEKFLATSMSSSGPKEMSAIIAKVEWALRDLKRRVREAK